MRAGGLDPERHCFAVELVGGPQARRHDGRHVAEEGGGDVGPLALQAGEVLPREHEEFGALGGARRGRPARAVDEAHLADHVARPEGSQRPVHVTADVLEDVHPPALDDEERIACVVLVEELLAAHQDPFLAGLEHHLRVLGGELREQAPSIELAVVRHFRPPFRRSTRP